MVHVCVREPRRENRTLSLKAPKVTKFERRSVNIRYERSAVLGGGVCMCADRTKTNKAALSANDAEYGTEQATGESRCVVERLLFFTIPDYYALQCASIDEIKDNSCNHEHIILLSE